MPELDVRSAVILSIAHLESEREAPDIKRMTALLYEAIHRSNQHPTAWFAAYMCYRRTRKWKWAQRAWVEACGRGDAEEYRALANKYH